MRQGQRGRGIKISGTWGSKKGGIICRDRKQNAIPAKEGGGAGLNPEKNT